MGSEQSRKVCDSCGRIHGSTSILEVYHHGLLSGKYLCIDCFTTHTRKQNVKTYNVNNNSKISKCRFCSNKNLNHLSDHNFKIHWYGKYNNIIMCEKCLFDKKRRR